MKLVTSQLLNFNPLMGYSATSNDMKLVHWPLMGGLLHLVQRGGDWVGPQPAQVYTVLHCFSNELLCWFDDDDSAVPVQFVCLSVYLSVCLCIVELLMTLHSVNVSGFQAQLTRRPTAHSAYSAYSVYWTRQSLNTSHTDTWPTDDRCPVGSLISAFLYLSLYVYLYVWMCVCVW